MDTTATVRKDFATRLYEKLGGAQAGQNLFLSPFSIQVALAMCAVGARGETRRVLADLARGTPKRRGAEPPVRPAAEVDPRRGGAAF